jgi:hypothetical protein
MLRRRRRLQRRSVWHPAGLVKEHKERARRGEEGRREERSADADME